MAGVGEGAEAGEGVGVRLRRQVEGAVQGLVGLGVVRRVGGEAGLFDVLGAQARPRCRVGGQLPQALLVGADGVGQRTVVGGSAVRRPGGVRGRVGGDGPGAVQCPERGQAAAQGEGGEQQGQAAHEDPSEARRVLVAGRVADSGQRGSATRTAGWVSGPG